MTLDEYGHQQNMNRNCNLKYKTLQYTNDKGPHRFPKEKRFRSVEVFFTAARSSKSG